MLAAGALVASLFAVGAAPVAAQPNSTASPNHNPDFGADWSACVGAAGSHDAMFPDVGDDNAHADAINCIAYYGITLGKGDGSYAPDENVNAFQMELFTQRAADLMGADGEAVLAGVMLSDTVTRLEMAQLMFGLVDDVDHGVRINPRDGQIQFLDDSNVWQVVDDFFADAKAQVPIADSQLIGATYELGITRGTRGDGTLVSTSGSTFEPFAPVTRAQMASFIARTLDHSNARPAGLSIQRNSDKDTLVSLRDADFGAIADARIDVFSALYPNDAFDADDGECESRFVKDETPSHSTCAVDIGDQLTDDQGNVEFTLVSDSDPIQAACAVGTGNLSFSTAAGSAGRTFWAWTGSLSDEVDKSTDLQELEDVARPVGAAGPDYLRVSGGLPTDDELAKMGETVTFTAQLYSQVGASANKDKDVAVGPDRSRNPYHLRIQKFYVARVDNTDSDYGDGTGETKTGSASVAGVNSFAEAPGDWNFTQVGQVPAATAFQTEVDTVVFPNSDGQFTINLTNLDLNAATDDTDVGVRFTLTPFTTGNDLIAGNLVSDVEADGNHAALITGTDTAVGYAIFSDETSDPHKVSGESSMYRLGSTGNSVTVSVVDQYGDPMRNVKISVSSTLDDATVANDEATYPEEVDITVQQGETDHQDPPQAGDYVGSFPTRRNGAYRIGYTYTGTEAQTETITPSSIAILGDNPATTDIETDFELVAAETGATVSVYWAKVGNSTQSDTTAGDNPEAVPVQVRDVASQTIVVNEAIAETDDDDNPMAYFYDEDDTFIVAGVGATFEMFEEALSKTWAADKIYAHQVEWENYIPTRPGRVNRTIWTLDLSCTAPTG